MCTEKDGPSTVVVTIERDKKAATVTIGNHVIVITLSGGGKKARIRIKAPTHATVESKEISDKKSG